MQVHDPRYEVTGQVWHQLQPEHRPILLLERLPQAQLPPLTTISPLLALKSFGPKVIISLSPSISTATLTQRALHVLLAIGGPRQKVRSDLKAWAGHELPLSPLVTIVLLHRPVLIDHGSHIA